MGGITSGVGIFSGIDSQSIISQLLAIEARPRDQAQARIVQLQLQNSAYLDINSRLSALRTAAKAFRDNKTFQTRSATSSNPDVLRATASTDAAPGVYQFIVDRLVSTQQLLSRGFANRDVSAVGLTQVTLESTQARLDRDVELSDLNSGAGVSRGRISITDSAGGTAVVDLSRTTTVGEVLAAINQNGTARVSARVQDGRLVVDDTAGGPGTMSIANTAGYTTASSLGIAGSATGGRITGSSVYSLHGGTLLSTLNDGRGVSIDSVAGTGAFNFKIVIDNGGGTPTEVLVNIGDVYEDVVPSGGGDPVLTRTQGAVTTVQGVIDRVTQALADSNVTDVSISVDATNGRLRLVDSTGTRTLSVVENGDTTATDLGFIGATPGATLNGKRVLATLNSTLGRGLNGGAGIAGDGALNFTLRNGATFSVTIDREASLDDIFRQIEQASDAGSGARVDVSLDERGTGIVVTDLTGASASNLIITGTSGSDTAASLGISTGPSGVASSTESSGNLQRQYMSRATLLSSLNAGRGIGTGTFRLVDSDGESQVVTISDSIKTVGDFIDQINSRGLRVRAEINSNGDGIRIVEDLTTDPVPGATKISISDQSGSVARSLNLAGTASGTGGANALNGTFERVVSFSAADTLDQVVTKLNQANAGVTAAIVRDGSSSAPFRLSLTSGNAGTAGRFIIDSGSVDLGLATLDAGSDSRVFYGSTDAARGVAIVGSSNTVDSIVPGVRIDLTGASNSPVTLNVQTDTNAIEKAVELFVSSFNTAIQRIDTQSRYDKATERGGPLLGDGTVRELRAALFRAVSSPGVGTSGRFNTLLEVGISVGDGGTLELDTDRLREALQEDPASVESLFVTRTQSDDAQLDVFGDGSVLVRNPNAGSTFSALGVMGQFEQLVDRYVDSTSGVLTGRTQGIGNQISLQNARIESYNARLEQRRNILERQFLAMEKAIGSLQSQQAALGSIGGVTRAG
ncbi:MAG: flagellar filament capping protein FliD [Planctomycetota bacterium]|nr:flagellar filament capping protein FliD [Planctomycetota bacterium]